MTDFEHDTIWREIHSLFEYYNELKEMLMSQQEEIDTITAGLEKVSGDIATVRENLQSEIDILAAQNPSVNLSGLRNAAAPLDAAVQALGELKPIAAPAAPPASEGTPPQPTPDPTVEQSGPAQPEQATQPTEPVARETEQSVAVTPPNV